LFVTLILSFVLRTLSVRLYFLLLFVTYILSFTLRIESVNAIHASASLRSTYRIVIRMHTQRQRQRRHTGDQTRHTTNTRHGTAARGAESAQIAAQTVAE